MDRSWPREMEKMLKLNIDEHRMCSIMNGTRMRSSVVSLMKEQQTMPEGPNAMEYRDYYVCFLFIYFFLQLFVCVYV